MVYCICLGPVNQKWASHRLLSHLVSFHAEVVHFAGCRVAFFQNPAMVFLMGDVDKSANLRSRIGEKWNRFPFGLEHHTLTPYDVVHKRQSVPITLGGARTKGEYCRVVRDAGCLSGRDLHVPVSNR